MPIQKTQISRFKLLLGAVVGIIGLSVLFLLAMNVVRDLRLLTSANSDNVQWTLSQAEVEFLEYRLALGIASVRKEPDLDQIRQEFDIFYSRIITLDQASNYEGLRSLPEFSRNLEIVKAFIFRAAQVIDGTDEEFAQALPELLIITREARAGVRTMSNSGLVFFAQDSDIRRTKIAFTLIQMALDVAFLLAALVVLVVYLNNLNIQNIRRRSEVVQINDRIKVVTSTALDAVIVTDSHGRIRDFNSAAEQIFGYAANDAIGNDVGALIVPDYLREAHNKGMQQLRKNGERHVVGMGRIKMDGKRANGAIIPLEFAVQSAMTEEGEIFIAFLRDISHRVKAEQDLVSARDRAVAGEKSKTDFLATMSHEIRTPLNGLLGNLSLLRETRLSAKQFRYIRNMETSGRLLMSHISDVLDITKYDAGKLRLRPISMNISALLQDIVDSQSGAAIANDTELDWNWNGPSVDWISADRDRIQHILMNVVGNAVKFTRNGRVTVEVEIINDSADVCELQFIISDTGIGMDSELQSQIFDDFMTGDSSYDREVGGTGLGLGIAQRFVKALGGTIEVESILGEGSAFCIRFPVKAIAPPEAVMQSIARARKSPASNILLVEDNEINRMVAREMLTAAGHKVTEARNGQIAVDLAETEHFDLILMDISMPVLDGREATRAIRAGQGPSSQTPIIALTANAMAEEQAAFRNDGMNDILTKPLTQKGLIRIVSNHVAHKIGKTQTLAPESPELSQTISTAYLEDLRATLGVKPLQSLLDRFITETDEIMDELCDHAHHPLAEIAATAHRLAGSAAALGALDLRTALVTVEQAAKAHDTARLVAAIDTLPKIWTTTRPLMQAERRRTSRTDA